ncbi:MAG: glycosyltransferase family 4 protein [Chlamydiae bacterium]|nr:glycosyltransferase family 4 protein [Chlamydiota bacterium]MBI3266511.1 glycosyltransferase family 4 protein [Chlamydiota bacterium]
MNSFSKGMSGGDACFIEIAKRMDSFDKVVVTSLLGEEACKSKKLVAEYLITTREKLFRRVIFSYLQRIIKSFRLKISIESEDILYATSDFLPDVLPAFYRKVLHWKRDVRWVQRIFHLIPSQRWIPHYAQKVSFFLIKRFADWVIVDNKFLREELLQRGFDSNKVFVNYPGIDVNYFKSLEREDPKSYDAVFLGRLHPSKGIFDLVDIWKKVCASRSQSKLAMIGDAENVFGKELKKKIKDAGLEDQIHVLGYLEDEEAFRIVKFSKVFVFPSYEEGFGMAILEAMACGLPIVAWDLPVYREVFPLGMVRISLGDKPEFSRAVLRLLDNPKLCEELIQGTNKVVEGYDWDQIAQRELELIAGGGRS